MKRLRTTLKIFAIAFCLASASFAPALAASNCDPSIGSFCGTDQPYYVVMGGDIAEGNDYNQGGSSCMTSQYDSLSSWNTNNYAFNGYYGAATQDATYTPDSAYFTASGINSDAPVGSPAYHVAPDTYSFANNFIPPAPSWADGTIDKYWGAYGGSFLPPCQTDYYSQAMSSTPAPTALTSTGALTNNVLDLSKLNKGGVYYYDQINQSQPLVIEEDSPITIAQPITLAVDGNVFVQNNIKYQYSNPNSIPNLNVYTYGTTNSSVNASDASTYGNIYVSSTVNEIHGFYVAEGNNQASAHNSSEYFTSQGFGSQSYNPYYGYTYGLFSTCAQLRTNGPVQNLDTAQNCGTQLTVVGSVSANVFWLERSYGSINSETSGTNASNAAEVFRYSPEAWLPHINQTNCSGDIAACLSSTTTYQSEVSLPPVL